MVLVGPDDILQLDSDELVQLRKKLFVALESYRKTMTFLAGDAPLGVLCLPKTTETILVKAGVTRVYDLFNRDLAKIKGLGDVRIGHLASRLNEFLPVS